MKHLAKILLPVAAVGLLATPSCVPPTHRNSPENAAKLAPKPSVVIDNPVVVGRRDSGEPRSILPAGVYTPYRRMGRGTLYANQERKIRVDGRNLTGGFFWADGAAHPEAYCWYIYSPMGVSGWSDAPTGDLRHISR